MTRSMLSCAIVLAGCGTLASPAGGDADLPNAHAGPFRLLRASELDPTASSTTAPYLVRNERRHYRRPAPLDADGDASTPATWLYAVDGDDDASSIVRFFADDGRSFGRVPDVALEPTEAWEGGRLSSPSALKIAGEVWLYYAAAEGVGLARSPDGRAFVKEAGPVLTTGLGCAKEPQVPRDPSVTRLPDGTFHMFWSQGQVLCEAVSHDGVSWHLVEGDGVVLRAREASPDNEGAFDTAALAHPFAMTATSPEGRLIVRVYYTGLDGKGGSSIGLAARYGASGALVRATSPVLHTELSPREPAVLAFDGFTLLYFTQQAGSTEALGYPAIAGAVAPATVSLDARVER